MTIDPSKITITNEVQGAFCFSAPCTDTFDGFEFKLTGVSVASVDTVGSSPNFLPAGGGPSNGPSLDLVSPTDLFVNLLNDNPGIGEALILNLQFVGATPPPSVPEPMSLALLGTGLLGVLIGRRAAKRGTR
jgi:hypothetical protein